MPHWIVSKYSDLDLTDLQNERSTLFITPEQVFSCASSFYFSMTGSSTIEVSIFMQSEDPFDQIFVVAYQRDITYDRFLGEALNSASAPNFVRGWHTLKITLPLIGTDIGEGYVNIT